MKKGVKLLMALVLFAGLVTGCSGSGDDSGKIKVGLNFELTGEVAEYGIAEANGVELAISMWNEDVKAAGEGLEAVGVKLDNQSNTAEAGSVLTKLATVENVTGIVGPATSGLTIAGYPIAEKHGVPMISPSATADGATQDADGNVFTNAFRTCFLDSFQGTAMAKFASENLGTTKAVVISDSSSDYAKGLSANFQTGFKAAGGTIVAEESYVEGDTDFSTILTKVAGLDFDVVYIPGYYNEVGLIIKQARSMGIEVPVVGGDGFDSATLIDLAGASALNDVYFTTAYTTVDASDKVTEFVEAYKAMFDAEPSMFSALAFDAANLLMDATMRAGSTDPKAVTEALAATTDFEGVTGTFSFDELHNPVKSVLVVSLVDGVQTTSTEVNP